MIKNNLLLLFLLLASTMILAQSDPETIEVSYPSERPYGYGSIGGWYGSKKSEYLLDHPIKTQYEQMNRNYVQQGEQWIFLHIPEGNELPDLGSWWNWEEEIEGIKDLIEDLGEKLGKFETHFISGTEVVNPLKWEKADNPQRFEILNTSLKNDLENKYLNNQPLNFTQAEWDEFGITDIYTFSYVEINGDYFKPVSPGNDRINEEVRAVINRDKKDGWDPSHLKVEACGGICYNYLTTSNRKRNYLVFNMGFWNGVADHILNNPSEEDKRMFARLDIYSSIAHEYNHVVQNQLYDPVIPIRWNGEENGFGEYAPNAISRWWIESFASILPEIMGYSYSYTLDAVRESINQIVNDNSLTADEFADRMMYVEPYGYLTRFNWGFLTAAYMAKLTSWKYVLMDFYFDFQRIPSNSEAYRDGSNTLEYVPSLDKIFLHHFGKTEADFLKELFTLVQSGEIKFEDLFPDENLPTILFENTTTSSYQLQKEEDFLLYPNPAQNMVYYRTSMDIKKIELYNMMGQIQSSDLNLNHKLDISALPDGIYFMRIYKKDGAYFSKKLVKSQN
jgi:hypothetical protein